MSKTDNDAANAETTKPSVSNVHDLRLCSTSSMPRAGEAQRLFWA